MEFEEVELINGVEEFCDDNKEDILTSLVLNDESLKLQKQKCGEIFKIDNDDEDDEIFSFLCTLCGTIFEDFIEFTAHIKESHNIKKKHQQIHFALEEKAIKIEPNSPNRMNAFQDVEELKNVVEKFYVETETTEIQEPSVKKEKNYKNQKLKKKSCGICDKTFYTEKRLTNHMMYDHIPTNPFLQTKNEIQKSQLTFEDDDDDDCEINGEQGKLKCNVQLIQQQQQNNDIDPLKCRYCGKRCISRRHRFEHECFHTGEKSYKCEFCNKYYRRKYELSIHIAIHQNKRNYKCEICGFAFNNKSNLNVHIRKHTGDKRYKCDYCDKKFVNSTGKKIHERIHTGEKPYQCVECGESFSTSSRLTEHKRKHTGEKPYQCKICKKKFKTSGEKQRHDRVHTGEKPFPCDICNSKFADKKGLKQHKQTHSDIRSYQCKICGRSFKQYAGLYGHMKSHGVEQYRKT